MRILYVSRETPIHPAGGIATYLEYVVPAMRAAGHEVFLFTWSEASPYIEPLSYAPFAPDHVHIERVNLHEAWRVCPVSAQNLFLSQWLSKKICAKIQEWKIDVVEATDYLSPGLTAFQHLQTSGRADQQLLVTYNHGFIEDFFEADQIGWERSQRANNLCERQQCRISDLVIAPSQSSRRRLASYGIAEDVSVIREPYVFSSASGEFSGVRNVIEYLGRISIAKGIDKLVLLTNALHEVYPLRQVRLIGRIVDTPFRKTEMRAYVRERLNPALRDNLFFTGYLPRETALNMLEPGAICPSLGSADTFSYACVESLDAGHLPVVRHGTPMFRDYIQHERAHANGRKLAMDVKYFGLNLIPQHEDVDSRMPYVVNFMRNNKAHVVHIIRRNKLRVHVSEEMSRATGVWSAEKSEQILTEKPKLKIDVPLALQTIRRLIQQDERVQFLLESVPAVSRLYYDEMFDAEGLFSGSVRDTAAHIMDIDDISLVPGNLKMNPEGLTSLVENYDELESSLLKTPHAWMLTDAN